MDDLFKTWIPQADAGQFAKLEAYYAILIDWNARMNLTAITDKAEAAQKHFADSLLPEALIPQNAKLIDVGTGAGFPGLALAVARPDLCVTLLEAQGKRCQFLCAVCDQLGLKNATVVNDRAEVLGRAPEHREAYDRALARAVAPLNVLCEYLLPFVRVGGCALCWKGPAVSEELSDAAAAALCLGGAMGPLLDMEDGQMDTRHVLAQIHKTEKTLPQYPRKNGIPAKRPLRADKA